VAVRPIFHLPALLAKQDANVDHISGGRLSLNVVSSWWAEEAAQYGIDFDAHDDRYARTAEWLAVVDGVWRRDRFSFAGRYYRVESTALQPKPLSRPRPTIYAGGESEAAKELIARLCDAYVMHDDPPARIAGRIADLAARRARLGAGPAGAVLNTAGSRSANASWIGAELASARRFSSPQILPTCSGRGRRQTSSAPTMRYRARLVAENDRSFHPSSVRRTS